MRPQFHQKVFMWNFKESPNESSTNNVNATSFIPISHGPIVKHLHKFKKILVTNQKWLDDNTRLFKVMLHNYPLKENYYDAWFTNFTNHWGKIK